MLEREPQDPENQYYVGVALGDLGKYEEAISFFDEALRRKPDFSDATLAKGFVLTKLGRKDEAKQCTDKLLEAKKEQPADAKGHDYASMNDSCRRTKKCGKST